MLERPQRLPQSCGLIRIGGEHIGLVDDADELGEGSAAPLLRRRRWRGRCRGQRRRRRLKDQRCPFELRAEIVARAGGA
jgi:hypothetical protein